MRRRRDAPTVRAARIQAPVLWRGAGVNGRATKIPISPRSGKPAACDRPKSWSTDKHVRNPTFPTSPFPVNVKTASKPFPFALLQELLYATCRSIRGNVTAQRADLPLGTMDLLILRTLALGRQHGSAISERVQQISSEVLRIQQGSLYPALHRLERRGFIKTRWGTSKNNRRAKYYDLSKSGCRQLQEETDSWAKLTGAVAQILGTS